MQTHKESRAEANLRAIHEASELPQPSIIDVDPEDPSQVLNGNGDMDLAADVKDEASEIETPSETTSDAYEAEAEDTGDLYGVHQPKAADRDLGKTADQEEFVDAEDGEHWLETLGKKSVESGVEPEKEVDVIDDSDDLHEGHHKSDTRDRPVADRGSGGDGGL